MEDVSKNTEEKVIKKPSTKTTAAKARKKTSKKQNKKTTSKSSSKKTTSKSSSKKSTSTTKRPTTSKKDIDLLLDSSIEASEELVISNDEVTEDDIIDTNVVIEVKEEVKEEAKEEQKQEVKDTPSLQAEQGILRYEADLKTGLTTTQVEERLRLGYNNVNNIKTTKSGWQIIKGNVFTFFNMLFLIIAILLIIAKSWTNLSFLIVVLSNMVISIVQEFKAKKVVEKLNLMTAPRAKVIRNGEKQEIAVGEVVLDDIIVFSTGNQIVSDSIVQEGYVEVNESMITGEADAIVKEKGALLYSGSYVVSGTCSARVEHVGKDNYIEKLAIEAKKQKENKSELLKTLNTIIKVIGFIIIPLNGFAFYQAFTGSAGTVMERFTSSIVSVAGSIIGMIPAGLFLLTTIALATGVYRLAKRNRTSVRQLYCIEMLARVDVLCLDKTGTITDGTMRVIDCIELKNITDYTMREIVGSMMSCFEERNATSEALIRFFDINKVLTPVRIIPFSSQRKFSAVAFKDVGTFYLGAPEFVLTEMNEKTQARINRFASQGCRVLAVGFIPTMCKNDSIPKNVKSIGLIVIQDHIRDDAYQTIEYFRSNGVDIKVISGDNPITVSEIASRAGVSNANRYVSLEGLSLEEVKEIAFDYTIFGRVSPTQKKALVEAYKEHKKTVAMTGDGVNDILALKEADCSIAMASGSEATRNVADIVLMDSNFSAMPSVVAEGRRVINNIQRTSTLFLEKTIFFILLTIFYICLGIKSPFEPSQIFLLIELPINGVSATVISLLPNNEKVQGKFISNVLRLAIPGAVTVLIFHVAIFTLGKYVPAFGWLTISEAEGIITTQLYTTMCLLITASISIFVLYRMCKPLNWVKALTFTLVTGFIILCVTLCGQHGTVGDFVNSYLKILWPLGNSGESSGIGEVTIEALSSLANYLVLILMVLMINPVMNLIEKFFGKVKQVKI